MSDSNTWPSRWRQKPQTSEPRWTRFSNVNPNVCNLCHGGSHELCAVFDKTGRMCNCYSATDESKARHEAYRARYVAERIAEHLGITI